MEKAVKKTKNPNGKNGSALLLAMILLFVVLSLVASLSYVTVMEQKMSQKSKSSVGAFYTSESGVEWALNKIATSTATDIYGTFGSNPGGGVHPSGVDYNVFLLDKDGKVISLNLSIDQVKAVRSVGTQTVGDPTQRAIEAAVASGTGGITGGCSESTTSILMKWGDGCKSAGSAIDGNNFCSDANGSGYVCGPSSWVPSNQVFCICVKN